MREAQIVKPRKGEVLETITSFQVKDVPKVKATPIRLKSRSRTPSGGMDRAVRRAADEAMQSMGTRKSDGNKGPEGDPPGIEPMSLIPLFFFAGAVRARSSDGHQSIGLDCPFPRMRIK